MGLGFGELGIGVPLRKKGTGEDNEPQPHCWAFHVISRKSHIRATDYRVDGV